MQKIKKSNFIKIFLIFLWSMAVIFAYRIHIPKSDADAHFLIMKNDMSVAQKYGGYIDDEYSNSKMGGASLVVCFSENTWNSDLAGKFQESFLANGWTRFGSNNDSPSFCKMGMRATIENKRERIINRSVGRDVSCVEMIYSYSTKRECKVFN